MDDEELIILFAAFAMLIEDSPRECWEKARAMVEAKDPPEAGIVAIKKRRSWTKQGTTSTTKTAKQFE